MFGTVKDGEEPRAGSTGPRELTVRWTSHPANRTQTVAGV